VFVDKPTTQEVNQGETAVFAGKIDGYPAPKVTWLLNGKPLTPKEGAQIENNPATGDVKVTISNVDLQQHAGSVTCRIENVHGAQEETVRLDVMAAPLIVTQLPKQEETVAGKDVTLRVVVRGAPRPEAQWFYNDVLLQTENASYDEAKGEFQLLIKEASVANNEGTYRVVLKNDLGEMESTPCALVVLEPVKLVKVAPESDTIDMKVDEVLEMSFEIDGKEAPKVQLTKDGKEVKFTSIEEKIHVYREDAAKPQSQGVYKVIAKNKTSSEEVTVTVKVTGKCIFIVQ
jgi:Immunoglobulin I-set domain